MEIQLLHPRFLTKAFHISNIISIIASSPPSMILGSLKHILVLIYR
jgi:hypothetical protein